MDHQSWLYKEDSAPYILFAWLVTGASLENYSNILISYFQIA